MHPIHLAILLIVFVSCNGAESVYLAEMSIEGKLRGSAQIKCEFTVEEWYVFYIYKLGNSTDEKGRLIVRKPNSKSHVFVISNKAHYQLIYTEMGKRNTFVLVIHELECGDDGIYKCQLAATETLQIKATLNVTADPLSPMMKPDPSTAEPVEPNALINLVCEANIGVPAGNITWYERKLNQGLMLLKSANVTTRSANDCRTYMVSRISITATEQLHNAKFTCYSHKANQNPTLSSTFAVYTVRIKGMLTTTVAPGKPKNVKDGRGLSSSFTASFTTLFLAYLSSQYISL